MSSLTVYHESSPDLPSKALTHVEDIASTLAEVGVRFERWEASAPIAPGASQDEVIAAYRPQIDRVTGLSDLSTADAERARAVMAAFSRRVTRFLADFLPPYAGTWRLDYASFRPVEERGRDLRKRARNDLLHVDSFASRPTGGVRILRVFLNMNPREARRWVTTDTFYVLLRRFGGEPSMS